MREVREHGLVGVSVIMSATNNPVQAWQAKNGMLSRRESRNQARADESVAQLQPNEHPLVARC